MITEDLNRIALTLVSGGKRILAADETVPTLMRRFQAGKIESTAESRRTYREMFFKAPRIADFISGVVMQDETIRQSNDQPPQSHQSARWSGAARLGRGPVVDRGRPEGFPYEKTAMAIGRSNA